MAREWFSVVNGRVSKVNDLYTKDDFKVKTVNIAIPHTLYNKDSKEYEDNGTTFIKVSCFGYLAEQVDKLDLQNGCVVMASGYLDKEPDYTDKEGNERTGGLVLKADQFAVSPLFGDIESLRTRDKKATNKKVTQKKPEPQEDVLDDDTPNFDDDFDF